MARVYCVIVGFSTAANDKARLLYTYTRVRTPSEAEETGESEYAVSSKECTNINAYLTDAPNVFVESRNKPLCDVPEMGIGNKPIDGGNYLFTPDEKAAFIAKEPKAAKYFRRWYGAEEFINGKERWCLWVGDCTPHELTSMKHVLERVKAVRDYRLKSPSEGTRKIADKPTRFHVENMPDGDYLLIPSTSSEKRVYIPIGFMHPDTIASNATILLPHAALYHFGILTSSVHMAWMRAVCGRLKSDYRYSVSVVYNNFPWPSPAPAQRDKIAALAQGVLDARALFPDATLADLYNDAAMPPALRKAHRALDGAVLNAYGWSVSAPPKAGCIERWSANTAEEEIVARLMEMEQRLAGEGGGSAAPAPRA